MNENGTFKKEKKNTKTTKQENMIKQPCTL